MLESACRMSDRIDDLEEAMRGQDPMIPGSRGQMIAHPLLAEIRMQRVAVSSLLRQLKLPDEGEGAARNQQRDAAVSRWTREYSREVR
ncbi:hypothetical protein R2Q81_06835 [Microbacterium aquimaris]|uniref:hypothetical protein n=1 Tax=Microbacterium aquimaris TaxID=459816 RepID=UPI002AD33FAA|nr:hypothetical protein [Microbacterium aquimaris]MDZ8275667.1 hypothetical protein [Microbacterium aquimaris]